MTVFKSTCAAAFALALLAPATSSATSLWHPATGELGYTEHWDHLRSAASSDQVVAELEAARKDRRQGAFAFGTWNPAAQSGPSRTRTEVLAELQAARSDRRLGVFAFGVWNPA